MELEDAGISVHAHAMQGSLGNLSLPKAWTFDPGSVAQPKNSALACNAYKP